MYANTRFCVVKRVYISTKLMLRVAGKYLRGLIVQPVEPDHLFLTLVTVLPPRHQFAHSSLTKEFDDWVLDRAYRVSDLCTIGVNECMQKGKYTVFPPRTLRRQISVLAECGIDNVAVAEIQIRTTCVVECLCTPGRCRI